jgi:hypothetical protein
MKLNLKLPGGISDTSSGALGAAVQAFLGGARGFRESAISLRKNRVEDATNAALTQVAADGKYTPDDLTGLPEGANMSTVLDTFNKGREAESVLKGRDAQIGLTKAQQIKAEAEGSPEYIQSIIDQRDAAAKASEASVGASNASRDLSNLQREEMEFQRQGLDQFGNLLKGVGETAEVDTKNAYEQAVATLTQKYTSKGLEVPLTDLKALEDSYKGSLTSERNKAILKATGEFIMENPRVNIAGTDAGKMFQQAAVASQDVISDVARERLRKQQDTRELYQKNQNPATMVGLGSDGKPRMLENQADIARNTIDWTKDNAVKSFAQELGLDPDSSAKSDTGPFGVGQWDSRNNTDGLKEVLQAAGGNRDIASQVVSKVMKRDFELLNLIGMDTPEKFVSNWEGAIEEAKRLRGELEGYAADTISTYKQTGTPNINDVLTGMMQNLQDQEFEAKQPKAQESEVEKARKAADEFLLPGA